MPTIWNTAKRRRTVRVLEFVCPRCGLDRPGAEVASKPWLHLVGVPVMPLGRTTCDVTCNACAQQYDNDVLEIPTTAELAYVLEAATVAAAISLVRAASDELRVTVQKRSVEMLLDSGFDFDDERLTRAINAACPDDGAARIRQLRDELTPFGKQGLLHRLTNVVMEDDTITTAHRDALIEIGRHLGIGPAHVHGAIAVIRVPADA